MFLYRGASSWSLKCPVVPIICVQTRAKRIILFGVFGHGNIGNDASLEAMLAFLRQARPDAELACVCTGPQVVRAKYHIPAISVSWPRSDNRFFRNFNRLFFKVPGRVVDLFYTLKAVGRFDVMIIPGTGILDDFGDRPWNMPYALFKWCLAARLCGVRIAFVSVGAGPMNHPFNRWLLKSASRFAQYRSYRDEGSKNFMESIGIDTRNDTVFPDIVFSLRTPVTLPASYSEGDSLSVGVGVMLYFGTTGRDENVTKIYKTYVRKITSFVLWLMDEGHRVRLLVGDTADLPVVENILNAIIAKRGDLPREQIRADLAQSYQDLINQIAETDIIVASRFHNLICALKLNRPAVSLGYRKRHEELMTEMGLGNFCQQIESLDIDRLIDQFKSLSLERRKFTQIIGNAIVVCQMRISLQEEYLTAMLL